MKTKTYYKAQETIFNISVITYNGKGSKSTWISRKDPAGNHGG